MDKFKVFIQKMIEKIKLVDKKILIKATIGLCILVVAFSYYGVKKIKDDEIRKEAFNAKEIETEKSYEENQDDYNENREKIIVQIAGAVSNPKICKLPQDTRVYQVIEEAGGLLPEADPAGLNLAAPVNDGDKIYIPKIGEFTDPEAALQQIEQGNSPSTNINSSTYDSKININRATREELQQIPGIGPQTADKIVNYRKENGIFRSPQDLKNVSGIGDKTFEKMKNMIRVN